MKRSITIEIDDDGSSLQSVNDQYLSQCWHIAQANPAPHGDRDAGELAEKIGREIIRRWLERTPAELYRHQGSDYFWSTLVKHGRWNDSGEWVHGAHLQEEA
jgi:hypothetical protein